MASQIFSCRHSNQDAASSLIAALAPSASAASACGVQWVYPAVVVILAWPIMALRASSLAPVWARWVLKKCLAARMVVSVGSPASLRACFHRRRSVLLVSGCPFWVNMRSSGWHWCLLARFHRRIHVVLLSGMNLRACRLLGWMRWARPAMWRCWSQLGIGVLGLMCWSCHWMLMPWMPLMVVSWFGVMANRSPCRMPVSKAMSNMSAHMSLSSGVLGWVLYLLMVGVLAAFMACAGCPGVRIFVSAGSCLGGVAASAGLWG